MALYHLFSHPVERAYRAGLCSKAALFLLLTTALTYIPPLLVAFRSHGEPARAWRVTRRGRQAQAGNPDLVPLTRPVSRRVLAEAELLRGAAKRALPAPSAARGSTGARARNLPRLEHVPHLQPAAGGSPARPVRVGAWFPPGPWGDWKGWRSQFGSFDMGWGQILMYPRLSLNYIAKVGLQHLIIRSPPS